MRFGIRPIDGAFELLAIMDIRAHSISFATRPRRPDTFFLKPTQSNNESAHFHELVHAIQWRLLGPDRFLFSYTNGLECFGYRHSPLEAMAYDAETALASSTAIFNVEKKVAEKLGL